MGIKWIKPSETKKEVPFPKLMQGSDTGCIVLMTRSGVGTVLHGGTHDYLIGHYSATWAMSCFEDYNKDFTIRNEEN